MIITKKGKSVSVLTFKEFEAQAVSRAKSLSPDELKFFQQGIREIVQMYQAGEKITPDKFDMIVNKYVALAKWKNGCAPVDPETFLLDDFYLGKMGKTLYPKLIDDFIELFSGNYYKVLLMGSIGCGKSTFAYISMARVLYELSCMKSPQRVCHIQEGSRLDLLAISVRVPLAKKAVYKPVCDIIEASPYFQQNFKPDITQDECRFPSSINFQPVANDTVNVLSLNVFGGIIDEVNFMDTPHNRAVSSDGRAITNAEQLYNSLSRRIKSRFMEGGYIPGKLFLLSSKRAKSDFTEKAVRDDADDPNVFVRDHAMWEVKPGVFMNSKMFRVLVGNDVVKSRIMKDGEELKKSEIDSGCYYIEVPEEFRSEFENELEGSLRDLAGIATEAIHPFIGNREALALAVDKSREHPFTSYEWVAGDDASFIWEKLCRKDPITGEMTPILHPYAHRHAAIDTSLTGDATGLAVGHQAGVKKMTKISDDGGQVIEELPIVVIDFMLRIRPPKGDEIQLLDVRRLIYELNKHGGFNITFVGLDGFQSVDSKQQFVRNGIQSEIISVDRSPDPYLALKHCIYDGRILFYEYWPLLDELKSLEWIATKKKVDHPEGGSKDVADAVASVCYTVQGLHKDSHRNIINSLPMPTPIKGGHIDGEGDDSYGNFGFSRLIQVSPSSGQERRFRGYPGESRYESDDR